MNNVSLALVIVLSGLALSVFIVLLGTKLLFRPSKKPVKAKELIMGYTLGEVYIYSGFFAGVLYCLAGLSGIANRMMPSVRYRGILEDFFGRYSHAAFYREPLLNIAAGAFYFASAYGLFKRKRWGLYVAWAVVAYGIVVALVALFLRGFGVIILAMTMLFFPILYAGYFWRRRDWFE